MLNTELSWPLITIIIPVYNAGQYLIKCLQTVVEQTYTNLEILLIDDGSVDTSHEICEEFARKDPRIKVFHQSNSGVSSARNKGLQWASGQYIGFVDSDDWIEKDMYEHLYMILKENEADISMCTHYIEEENLGTRISCEIPTLVEYTTKEALITLFHDKIIHNYLYDKLFKFELFNDIVFPEGYVYEDVSVICKLFHKANKMVMSATPKYHYRIHAQSITHSEYSLNKDFHYFLALHDQYHFYMQNGITESIYPGCFRKGIKILNRLLCKSDCENKETIMLCLLDKLKSYQQLSLQYTGLAVAFMSYVLTNHFDLYSQCIKYYDRMFGKNSR